MRQRLTNRGGREVCNDAATPAARGERQVPRCAPGRDLGADGIPAASSLAMRVMLTTGEHRIVARRSARQAGSDPPEPFGGVPMRRRACCGHDSTTRIHRHHQHDPGLRPTDLTKHTHAADHVEGGTWRSPEGLS